MRRLISLTTAAVLITIGLATPAQAKAQSRTDPRPAVFVHGSAGSAMQFRTQAKRLASNGYRYVEAHEYDSPDVAAILPAIYAGLDARITRLLSTSGADRVDLLAHSLGTFVIQGYLNSAPERAARVAHYVNLDGRPAAALPGGVETLAIWGEGDPARAVTGATNVHFPDQSHTQTVSSEESFREIFRFLRDREPRTSRITPQLRSYVSGRAVLFPSNAGVTDAKLEVYPISPLTGRRLGHRPAHVRTIGADGVFGPLPLHPHARYEFALIRAGQATHHFYFEPFLRSDSLLRLLTSRPGEGIGALVDTSERHTALTFQRQKEWWGAEGDQLFVNGRNILNGANAPRAKRVIGVFAFDDGSDGVTDLATPIPDIFAVTFMTGIDVFVPAQRTTSIVVRHRDGGYSAMPIPSWPSASDRVSLEVADHR